MVDAHGNMRLISKLEFLLVSDLVNVLITFVVGFCSSSVFTSGAFYVFLRVNFSLKDGELSEQFAGFDARDGVDRDVWGFVLKTAVHVNLTLNLPAGGTEALNSLEFVPLARLSVIDFHGYVFTYLVRATADDHHQRAEE